MRIRLTAKAKHGKRSYTAYSEVFDLEDGQLGVIDKMSLAIHQIETGSICSFEIKGAR